MAGDISLRGPREGGGRASRHLLEGSWKGETQRLSDGNWGNPSEENRAAETKGTCGKGNKMREGETEGGMGGRGGREGEREKPLITKGSI